MLAHELRNSLQPIRTAVELVRRPHVEPEQMRFGREVIERQVNQLVRLVDDLMDASRITTSKLRLVPGRVDLRQSVASAVDAIHPLVQNKQQRLDIEMPDESLENHADGARLMQVFVNLLSNAVKFTPANGHIVLSGTSRRTAAVGIRVRDDGAGIAAGMNSSGSSTCSSKGLETRAMMRTVDLASASRWCARSWSCMVVRSERQARALAWAANFM